MGDIITNRFVDYLNEYKRENIHTELIEIIKELPKGLENFQNMIIYGPSGIGKYTQTLVIIEKYSQSKLKYEKKAIVSYNKEIHNYRLSDIHVEIDMEMLGCNSKTLWNEIIKQLYDIISSLNKKYFIVLCKNFDKMRIDLMEIFYHYMNSNIINADNTNIKLKYIFLTENLSCIPDNIINISLVLPIIRPTNTKYKNIIKKKIEYKKINNIKDALYLATNNNYNKVLIEYVISNIIHYDELDIQNLRQNLYNLLTYNLQIDVCIKDIIIHIIKVFELSNVQIKKLFIETNNFLKLYNNNYRPIYHLENFILTLIKIINNI